MTAIKRQNKEKRQFNLTWDRQQILLMLLPVAGLILAARFDHLTQQTHSFVSFLLLISLAVTVAWWRDIEKHLWVASWAGFVVAIPAIIALDDTAGDFSTLGVMGLGILAFVIGQHLFRRMTVTAGLIMLAHSGLAIVLMYGGVALFRAQVPVLLAPVAMLLAAMLYFLKRASSGSR
jgi:hypothetical protein